MPSRFAFVSTASSAAPGLNQTSFAPAAAISGSTAQRDWRRQVDADPLDRFGKVGERGKAVSPSTSLSFGFTGKTRHPACDVRAYRLVAELAALARCAEDRDVPRFFMRRLCPAERREDPSRLARRVGWSGARRRTSEESSRRVRGRRSAASRAERPERQRLARRRASTRSRPAHARARGRRSAARGRGGARG